MKHRKGRGFTLIELLVVVAIIGIIVATSIVNFLNAIQRARQRRTMAEIRTVGTAVEAYASDYNHYPPSSAFTLPTTLGLPTLTIGVAATYLNPTYIKRTPLFDGWNSWFTYSVTAEATDYCLRSNGKDGIAETTPNYGITTNFNNDIMMVDGTFVQLPDGVQE